MNYLRISEADNSTPGALSRSAKMALPDWCTLNFEEQAIIHSIDSIYHPILSDMDSAETENNPFTNVATLEVDELNMSVLLSAFRSRHATLILHNYSRIAPIQRSFSRLPRQLPGDYLRRTFGRMER